ncbi:MAG: DUF1902 domain-containing protein [Aestuariivirga sp.]
MKRTYFVRALWDSEAKVFYSESDIFGLHIEAATIEEFESVMNDVAADLIIANHYSAQDIATIPMRELVPAILWQRPEKIPAVI